MDEVFAPDDLMDLPIKDLAVMLNRRRGHLKRMIEGKLSDSIIKRQQRMIKAAEIAVRSRKNEIWEYFVLMSINELRDDRK